MPVREDVWVERDGGTVSVSRTRVVGSEPEAPLMCNETE